MMNENRIVLINEVVKQRSHLCMRSKRWHKEKKNDQTNDA